MTGDESDLHPVLASESPISNLASCMRQSLIFFDGILAELLEEFICVCDSNIEEKIKDVFYYFVL